jgi:hypothetical protein
MQTIYNVSIAAYTVSGSDPTVSGFIDNTTCAQYLAEAPEPEGFTLAQAQSKVCGNLRWKFILQQLALMGNPYVSNIVAAGATIDTDATTFSFDVYFEHNSDVYVNNGGTILTGVDAIQFSIATILTIVQCPVVCYYNPTTTTTEQNDAQTTTFDYDDQITASIVVGALSDTEADAAANITVTVIA